jgi:serine/threonine kinase 38
MLGKKMNLLNLNEAE